MLCVLIDVGHELDLVDALGHVELVDADGVDPEELAFVSEFGLGNDARLAGLRMLQSIAK